MTDAEIIEQAKATFVLDTPTERLAREVIAIAEERAQTIACEVEHSRKLEDQFKYLHGLLTPLKEAVLFARAQRRPLGIGQDFEIGKPTVTLGVCPQYGRERDNPGFHMSAEDIGPEDADSPSPAKRIALALLRLAYSVAETVKVSK